MFAFFYILLTHYLQFCIHIAYSIAYLLLTVLIIIYTLLFIICTLLVHYLKFWYTFWKVCHHSRGHGLVFSLFLSLKGSFVKIVWIWLHCLADLDTFLRSICWARNVKPCFSIYFSSYCFKKCSSIHVIPISFFREKNWAKASAKERNHDVSFTQSILWTTSKSWHLDSSLPFSRNIKRLPLKNETRGVNRDFLHKMHCGCKSFCSIIQKYSFFGLAVFGFPNEHWLSSQGVIYGTCLCYFLSQKLLIPFKSFVKIH